MSHSAGRAGSDVRPRERGRWSHTFGPSLTLRPAPGAKTPCREPSAGRNPARRCCGGPRRVWHPLAGEGGEQQKGQGSAPGRLSAGADQTPHSRATSGGAVTLACGGVPSPGGDVGGAGRTALAPPCVTRRRLGPRSWPRAVQRPRPVRSRVWTAVATRCRVCGRHLANAPRGLPGAGRGSHRRAEAMRAVAAMQGARQPGQVVLLALAGALAGLAWRERVRLLPPPAAVARRAALHRICRVHAAPAEQHARVGSLGGRARLRHN